MPIVPLPQFEADVAELERERLVESLRGKGHDPEQLAGLSTDELETLDRKKKPDTLVVRYGRMKMIGEFPYKGDMTPGCGSKLVVRTHSLDECRALADEALGMVDSSEIRKLCRNMSRSSWSRFLAGDEAKDAE